SRERIFGCDLRQFQRGVQHAVQTFARKIARMRAGRALALKYTKADGLRSGFFQGFDLAKAHERGELVAFADHTLRSGRPARHSSADDVMCKFLQISFHLWFESCFRHKSKSFHHGETEGLLHEPA